MMKFIDRCQLFFMIGIFVATQATASYAAESHVYQSGCISFCSDIQAAIDASLDGDVVTVHSGTYHECITIAKNITVRSDQGAVTTILQPPLAPDLSCTNSLYGVVTIQGSGDHAVLDGFTIRNGTTMTNGFSGGITIGGDGYHSPPLNPSILNCIIKDNASGGLGGGILSLQSGLIAGCTIENNSAAQGGGAALGSAVINNCVIRGNSASSYGGGLRVDYGTPSIENCIISGNTALYGAGIWLPQETGVLILNTTISANKELNAEGLGGGIFKNGIGGPFSPIPQIRNTIVYNNFPKEIESPEVLQVTYSDVKGGYAGIGNINANP